VTSERVTGSNGSEGETQVPNPDAPEESEPMYDDDDTCDYCAREAMSYNSGDRLCDEVRCHNAAREQQPKKAHKAADSSCPGRCVTGCAPTPRTPPAEDQDSPNFTPAALAELAKRNYKRAGRAARKKDPARCIGCDEVAGYPGSCKCPKPANSSGDTEPYWKQLPDALRADVLETHYLTAKECLSRAVAERDMWKKGCLEWQERAAALAARSDKEPKAVTRVTGDEACKHPPASQRWFDLQRETATRWCSECGALNRGEAWVLPKRGREAE